jgi:hypothetical protein
VKDVRAEFVANIEELLPRITSFVHLVELQFIKNPLHELALSCRERLGCVASLVVLRASVIARVRRRPELRADAERKAEALCAALARLEGNLVGDVLVRHLLELDAAVRRVAVPCFDLYTVGVMESVRRDIHDAATVDELQLVRKIRSLKQKHRRPCLMPFRFAPNGIQLRAYVFTT